MDLFWYMIIGVVIMAVAALITALYTGRLYKDFPKVIKAKVMREEKLVEVDPVNRTEEVRYRYHFKGRDKGNKMLTDTITYKEKKFKVGEKVSVHMADKGVTCRSDIPLWPAATSAICILLGFVFVFIYISGNRSNDLLQTQLQESITMLEHDTGYYVVTDTDVLFNGEKLGLVMLAGDASAVSTGDYGYILYEGEPHKESNSALVDAVHIAAAKVDADGTFETLDAALVEEIQGMGYEINTVSTLYAELAETAGEHTADDGHDHSHDLDVEEHQEIITTNPEETTAPSDTTTEEVVEATNEATESSEN